MKKIMLIFSCVLFIAACNNNRITHGKFVKILTEMYLYEHEIPPHLGPTADSTHIYFSIFEKYGATKAQFDSTLQYYSERPREMKSIYEKINKNLVVIKDKADKEIALTEKKSNLWKGNNKYTFQREGKPRLVRFNVKTQGTGVYQVSATVRYFADDSTMMPHMTAYLSTANPKDTVDLKRMDFVRDNEEKDYFLEFSITDEAITHIKGYWLNVDDTEKKSVQHIQVHKLRIKKIKSLDEPSAPDMNMLDIISAPNPEDYIRYMMRMQERSYMEDSVFIHKKSLYQHEE